MPPDPSYRPETAFSALGERFSDPVAPAAFPAHVTRYRNQRSAESVGLGALTAEEWVSHFGRFESLPGGMPQPRAIRYHGHQFRHYNPDLGDGRGFLFAQLHDGDGRLLDLSTKGSGQTPYSRSGDGRLTLKGGVREVLASALLEARGVSTSKAFSLIETGEELFRQDEPSPTRSAVLTRLSWSHLRFGVFQRHAYHGDQEALRALVEHAAAFYVPEIAGAEDPAAALLSAACRNMGRLTAQWMAAGFVHGVLNTDNVTIMGESFDYGPYRFLPHFEPGFTAAYFDHGGLYAFARQPEAVFWNCQALASALSGISEEEALISALREFEPAYRLALREAMLGRLGVLPSGDAEADLDFVRLTLSLLEKSRMPWEPFFQRWFGGAARGTPIETANATLAEWRTRFFDFTPDRPGRMENPALDAETPVDLLYDEIEEIWEAIDERDDWAPFNAKLDQIETYRLALYG